MSESGCPELKDLQDGIIRNFKITVTYHLSPVTYHLSPVTSHQSPVTSHLILSESW
ncbi:hypothetical protein H5968_15530 [Sphaerospermopsis sp. LEGE 00249]|uniref:hypothetical protein n=1 Tax=Sphaerospermopsis sp. LEGE 00249 TaxID=1380707 RepID=UPI00164EC244|nr:hypothetical protein [Sphaerospermopsis sp. LEGE 00249]MBC5796520.1 hypothetical protein [Sphaerospermopsis sp. LEGE 00249]